MDPQSPPKRITRSRAAAKASESTVKTAKIVTAAAKARAARATAAGAASASTTATKRKTRSDDIDDEDDQGNDEAAPLPAVATKTSRATRGRAKKPTEEPEPATGPAAAPKARGRPKKTAEPARSVAVKDSAKPIRAARTARPQQDDGSEKAVESAKNSTRVRAVPAATASKSTAGTRVKKTVKFNEPEKENISPAVQGKGKTAVGGPKNAPGLRAKPVRRAASTATRATRSQPTISEEKESKPSPLSPKKVTQLSLNRTDSEDELTMADKTPLKPMMRAPVKAPIVTKPRDPVPTESVEDTVALNPPDLGHSLFLGTPAKRLPASPWKGSMKSPARKVDVMLAAPPSVSRPTTQPAQSPMKVSLLQSPAKRSHSPTKGLEIRHRDASEPPTSALKYSLFSSPAKRPMSPVKFPPMIRVDEADTARSSAPKPALLSTPTSVLPEEMDPAHSEDDAEMDQSLCVEEKGIPDSPSRLSFPGRLSAVLPRHADPALREMVLPLPKTDEEVQMAQDEAELAQETESVAAEEMVEYADAMVLDETLQPETEGKEVDIEHAIEPVRGGAFSSLRMKDLATYEDDSDSEDELAPTRSTARALFTTLPNTPCSSLNRSASGGLPGAQSTVRKVQLDAKIGFTPLARQLSGWTAGASPSKSGIHAARSDMDELAGPVDGGMDGTGLDKAEVAEPSPVRGHFFDDEMLARDELLENGARVEQDEEDAGLDREIEEPVLNDIPVTEEDVALATEANDMSLMDPSELEEMIHGDSASEASQEYGDENEMPIDPRLLAPGVPPVTPERVLRREFHTTSKVPLKPADESTPRPRTRKRRHSISRLSPQRPTQNLKRSATVISYSPAKQHEKKGPETNDKALRAGSAPPATPAKSEANWSTAGTPAPARTPRRDVNTALLRGAVVHVDVHTSEGADASNIFVELLTQMGARCVKTWTWNLSSPPVQESSSSRVGITHVVFKDGGKRTLEKVRESGGVVQCVGVSWVLE